MWGLRETAQQLRAITATVKCVSGRPHLARPPASGHQMKGSSCQVLWALFPGCLPCQPNPYRYLRLLFSTSAMIEKYISQGPGIKNLVFPVHDILGRPWNLRGGTSWEIFKSLEMSLEKILGPSSLFPASLASELRGEQLFSTVLFPIMMYQPDTSQEQWGHEQSLQTHSQMFSL